MCELVVRVLFGAPLPERLPLLIVRANAHRGWEMVPGQDHYTYHHPVRVNALGLRGAELDEKRPDECRVLALGDSMVYGQGVGDGETIPAYMQARLDDRDRSYTVVNAGLRGYNTLQELALLRELGPVIRPDVVVLFWYLNDIGIEPDPKVVCEILRERGDVCFDRGVMSPRDKIIGSDVRRLLRRSAFLNIVNDAWMSYRAPSLTDSIVEGYMDTLEAHLRAFRRLAALHRFRFMVAIVPDRNSVRGGSPRGRALELRVRKLVESHGIRTLDLLAAVQRTDRDPVRMPIIPYDGHYNAAANRAMASDVVEFLLGQGFLSGSPSTWAALGG